MQTKRQKQIKALNNLLAQLAVERENRARLQAQSYYTVVPTNAEFRLSREVNDLKRKLGAECQTQPSPF
jgi:hypothetical protein